MRLSATDVYAFQALGYLGNQELTRWVSSEEISEATGVHRPYLVRILAALSAKGVVKSKKGIGGGYALARKPALISLCEVVRAVDGPVAPLSQRVQDRFGLSWTRSRRIWANLPPARIDVLGHEAR